MRLASAFQRHYCAHNQNMSGSATTAGKSAFLIYLVDDEEIFLDMAEVALFAEGYKLKKFHDPQTAFESFTQEVRKPSLLLTDYAMGSMNGIELSLKCKSAHPALKVLLVSGTAGPEILPQFSITVDKFMQKPYEPQELASTVRSLLAAAPAL
jgi:DNA-binding NtrC family response regulator